MREQRSHEILVASAAVFFVLVHLALARVAIEDIDSINFALGVHDYDVARHQPHPPGYPVYIAVARGASVALERAVDPAEPVLLALVALAGLAGGVAVVALGRLLTTAGCSRWTATATALVFGCAPLPWLTAARPLSDMPGLAVALVGQGLLLHLFVRRRPVSPLHLGAIGVWVGLAIGVRSQVLWLTLPLLVVVVFDYLRSSRVRGAVLLSMGVLAGGLAWAVPMVALTGGAARYLEALGDQAGDDFEGVPMLAVEPRPERLLTAMSDSFIGPWATPELAAGMLGLALVGLVAAAGRAPRLLWLTAVLWGPYAVFHLLFQETETTRYALPLVVPASMLAMVAMDLGVRRLAPRAVTPLAIVLLGVLCAVSLRAHYAYRHAPESVSDAIREMRDEAAARPPAQIVVHRRVWAETRRAREVMPLPGMDGTPAPRAFEWAALRPLMGRARVYGWWLVDPQRGDRAAVDSRGLHLRERYAWPATVAPLLGGMRPRPFDWYVVDEPSWVLDEGWALTPELAGLSHLRGRGPSSLEGARAIVRGAHGARTLLVGGRHIGVPSAAQVRLSVAVGNDWQADARLEPGAFRQVWTIPAASRPADGADAAQTLVVRTESEANGAAPVLLEQFDIQPVGVPVVALGEGWFEPERDVVSGRRWRWMAEQAILDIWGADCDVRLTLQGRWPRHYGEPPEMSVRATASGTLFEGTVTRPFEVSMVVPRRARVDGRVRLEVTASRSFVAGQHTGSADARRLSFEMGDVHVEPLSGGRSCPADVDSRTHESVGFGRSTTRGIQSAATRTATYSRSPR